MDTNVEAPVDKYSLILDQYSGITAMHPLVAQLDEDTFRNFALMFDHDIDVINVRSQDLDDHEITAAQKACSLMARSGHSNGALQLYVEEILGFRYLEPAEGMLDKLAKARLPFILRKLLPAILSYLVAHKLADESEGTAPANPSSLPTSTPLKDAKLSRLLDMCEKAQKEFRAKRAGTFAQKSAAKFLCNTIENTMSYIKALKTSVQSSSVMLPDDTQMRTLRSVHSEVYWGLIKGFQGKRGKPVKSSKAVRRRPHPTLVREDATLRSPHQQEYRVALPAYEVPTFQGIPRGGDRYRPTYLD